MVTVVRWPMGGQGESTLLLVQPRVNPALTTYEVRVGDGFGGEVAHGWPGIVHLAAGPAKGPTLL